MAANPDYKDLLDAFYREKVEYLVVGAHAVMFHAQPRYTKDLNLLVRSTPENAQRVWLALEKFGAPLQEAKPQDFCNPAMIYQVGLEPNRVDVMMSISGVDFQTAWTRRVESTYDGVPIHVISREDLVLAKRASGRPQDLLDLERLGE